MLNSVSPLNFFALGLIGAVVASITARASTAGNRVGTKRTFSTADGDRFTFTVY